MAARESGRIKDANQKRVLDDAARKRRQRKALEALEQDNFHDDPHADLVMSKKVPKFQETLDSRGVGRKKKTKSAEYYKQRFRKTFSQLVEEDHNYNPSPPNYTSAQSQPSQFPDRHFCAVCGFPSDYTCIPCGARYCCIRCLGTHLDTRWHPAYEIYDWLTLLCRCTVARPVKSNMPNHLVTVQDENQVLLNEIAE